MEMISIKDEKPPVGVSVLCQWKKVGWYKNEINIYHSILHRNEDDEWIGELGMCTGKVTHWCYLPEVVNE